MLIALLLAASAQPQVLAVLEFKDKLPKGGDLDVGYLTDVVRNAAKDAVPSLKVITRENMLVLLQASGKKVEECEGECEVDTGRRVGADVVVSGEVLKFGSQYKINMKLHDTHEGELLSGAIASGASADEVDRNLVAAVAKLLAPLEGGSAPRQAKPQQPAQDPRVRTQPASIAAAPAPRSDEFSRLGILAHLDFGYVDASSDVPGSSSSSGSMFGVGGMIEYRISRNIGVGLFGEYDSLKDNAPSASSHGHLSAGPALDFRAGSFSANAGLGYSTWTGSYGTGLMAIVAADYAIVGPLAVHGQFTYGAAHPDPTLLGGTVALAFVTLEIGVGILY